MVSRVKKYLGPSEHTSLGHLKTISENISATHQTPQPDEPDEPKPPTELITASANNINVYVYCFENLSYDDQTKTRVDLADRYLDTLFEKQQVNLCHM